MEFIVSLEAFDGPLDLMLHLIKEQKLDIFNLDMAVLADQYIAFIHAMENLHLDVASEYLEELASLLEYKSRKLLPRFEDNSEDNYEQDQREQLVARLLEYQKYKEAAAAMADKMNERSQLLSREPASLISEWQQVQEVYDDRHYKPAELYKAMLKSLKRQALLNPYQTQVSVKEISIEERSSQILGRDDLGETFSLEDLCSDCTSLHMVIVTFLAVLSCIHDQQLLLAGQEDGQIWLKKGTLDE